MEEELRVMVMVCTFHLSNQNQWNKMWATVCHQTISWDKAKYFAKSYFPSRLLIKNRFLHTRMLHLYAHPRMGEESPCGQISLPRSNFQCEDHWTQFPKLNVSARPWKFQAYQGRREWTRQDVWFCLSLFSKLCMLAHQTLVCISLRTTVLIAIVHVSCWKSELTLEGELARVLFFFSPQVWSDFSCDHVIMCFWHRRVVLLSRPSWMLIKMNDYYNTFCVACWMNLHVNCRPI